MVEGVVIVTGGANGIGRNIAITYAKEGARVVVADIDLEAGKALEEELVKLGYQALFVPTDVSKPADINQLMTTTISHYGQINSLINNAGISKWQSPYDLKVEEWDYIMNVNLRSVFLCSRGAATFMKKQGGGAIINIASTRALMSEQFSEAYAATKGGILALTHALATSFSKDGIRVNAISPGWIETGDYEKLSVKDHQQHLSKRVGKPEDISRLCLFLTDDRNGFINGENIVVDGGMTRKMIYEE